jgi:hypothetical protein
VRRTLRDLGAGTDLCAEVWLGFAYGFSIFEGREGGQSSPTSGLELMLLDFGRRLERGKKSRSSFSRGL